MKRKDLVKYLLKNNCIFLREGPKHSIFFNSLTKKSSTIPCHSEIDDLLARKICRDLGVAQLR